MAGRGWQADALHKFVEKDDKGAMAEVVLQSLQRTQAALQTDTAATAAADNGGDVQTFILEAARQRRQACLRNAPPYICDTAVGVCDTTPCVRNTPCSQHL